MIDLSSIIDGDKDLSEIFFVNVMTFEFYSKSRSPGKLQIGEMDWINWLCCSGARVVEIFFGRFLGRSIGAILLFAPGLVTATNLAGIVLFAQGSTDTAAGAGYGFAPHKYTHSHNGSNNKKAEKYEQKNLHIYGRKGPDDPFQLC